MKRYDSYKPSGVEWIGEIPSHWEVMRFKDFMSLKSISSANPHKIGLENIESQTGKFIETDTEFDGNGVDFVSGDILYGKLRPYLQKVWLAEFSGNAVGDFFVFCHKKNSVSRYLKYLLLSDGFTKMANGSTEGAKMPRVSSDFILSLHCCLPSVAEQKVIADYLDEKCGEIDKSIAKQQRRIELLEELKQSVITQAVTRGLDPNVPLRDSGIEWIAQIPEHWNRLRLKHTALQEGGTFIDGDWIESKDIASEGVKYLTSGNVGVLQYKEQGSGFITEETFDKLECKDVYPGDILISRLNEPISRACLVPSLNSRIVTCVDNVIYRPDNNIFEYRFVIYVLNNYYYTEYANLIARGTTMHRIARLTLGGISIPVPSLSEQQAIADYLDKRCTEIDSMIEREKKKIELMQELKQSIITEVVTGKRKVV